MNFNSQNLHQDKLDSTENHSEEYSFAIYSKEHGVEADVVIAMTQVSTNKQKFFFQAGSVSVANLYRHMHSLSDTLCGQWFQEKQPKVKKNAQ